MYYKQYQKNNGPQAYTLQPYIYIVTERIHFRQETQDVCMYYMHASCTLELATIWGFIEGSSSFNGICNCVKTHGRALDNQNPHHLHALDMSTEINVNALCLQIYVFAYTFVPENWWFHLFFFFLFFFTMCVTRNKNDKANRVPS